MDFRAAKITLACFMFVALTLPFLLEPVQAGLNHSGQTGDDHNALENTAIPVKQIVHEQGAKPAIPGFVPKESRWEEPDNR